MIDPLLEFAEPVGQAPIRPENDPLREFAEPWSEPIRATPRQLAPAGLGQTGPSFEPGGARLRAEARQRQREEQSRIRGEEIESILRHPFDYTTPFSQSIASADYLLEVDISRSKDFMSARSKFLNKYPEGDYRVTNLPSGGQAMVARRSPDDPYREFRTSAGVISAIASEHTVFGAVGSFAGALGTAGGVAVGELVQRQIERSRGFESSRSPTATVGGALQEGAIAGVVDAATRRVLRIAKLAPAQQDVISALETYARLATEASKRGIAIEGIAVGQTGEPFMRGIFFQVGATAGAVERKIARQRESLYNLFVKEADNIPVNSLSDDALDLILEESRRRLSSINSSAALSRPQTGTTLRDGIETWKSASEEAVDRLYNTAISFSDEVAFDISPVKSTVANIRRGVVGRGTPVQRESSILDASGRPVPVTEIPDVPIPRGRNRVLDEAMDAIDNLDASVSSHRFAGQTDTGFEQIKSLRTRLFDLKESPNIDPDVQRAATRLWSDLTDVLNNPTGGAYSADFQIAWRRASDAHRQKEEVLRINYVKTALNDRTTTPEALAARYAKPGHETELRQFKEMLPTDSWNNFRNYLIDDMMYASNPRVALNRLDDFVARDSGGLRLIMSPQEEQILRRYLLTSMQEQSTPWLAVRTKAMGEADRALDLVNRSSSSELERFINLSGGMDSAQGQALRAGVYRDILTSNNATSVLRGVEVVDPAIIHRNIQRWKDSGKLKTLFSEADWQMISDVQSYSSFISEAGDIGGGMMAGTLRTKALDAPVRIMQPGGVSQVVGRVLKPLFTNDATAFILSRNATRANYQPFTEGSVRRIRHMTMMANLAYRNYEIPELEQQD